MAQPSLLIPPQRFSTGKLFAYSPQQSTPVEFSVTRGTTAFRTNVSGTLQSAASGIARLDYRYAGALQSCPALLVEPAATNLALRSEEFDNAYWSKVNATISANAAVSPNGTTTADKLIPSSGSIIGNAGNGVASRVFTLTASTSYTFSVFARAGEFNSIRFRIVDNVSFLQVNAIFNLSTGSITSSPSANAAWSGVSASIISIGSYYRVIITGTYLGAGLVTAEIFATDSVPTTGNGTNGIFIWGAQLETGTRATSYIPTVAATATRNADVISLTGASGYIGQTQGGVAGRLAIGQTSLTRTVMVLSDGTVNNRIHIYVNSSNQINADVVQGGVTQSTLQSPALASGTHAYCLSYQSGTARLYVNGTLAEADSPVSIPACNQFLLGSYIGGIEYYNGHLGVQALFKEALTTAELIDFSTL